MHVTVKFSLRGTEYSLSSPRGRGLRVNSTPAASDDKEDLVDSVNTQHIGSLHFYDNLMLIGTMGPLQKYRQAIYP